MNLDLSFYLSGNLSDYKYNKSTILDIIDKIPEDLNFMPKILELPVLTDEGIELEKRVTLFNESININFYPDKIEFEKNIKTNNINEACILFLNEIDTAYKAILDIPYFTEKKFSRIASLTTVISDEEKIINENISEYSVKSDKIESTERYLDRCYVDDLDEELNIITSISKEENQRLEKIKNEFPKIYKFTKDINSVPYIFDERIGEEYISKFISYLKDNIFS